MSRDLVASHVRRGHRDRLPRVVGAVVLRDARGHVVMRVPVR